MVRGCELGANPLLADLPLGRLSVTLEGFFVTMTSLQAYVVVARKSERMNRSSGGWSFIPPPRVFNACFVLLTVGMAGAMVVSACFRLLTSLQHI